jgi:hypothetical protein
VIKGKICCELGNKSLNIKKYCTFFLNFFKPLIDIFESSINSKDPDLGGKFFTKPLDPDPQHIQK